MDDTGGEKERKGSVDQKEYHHIREIVVSKDGTCQSDKYEHVHEKLTDKLFKSTKKVLNGLELGIIES